MQRDLLNLAYAVNAYTLGGKPGVKAGAPVEGYRCPTAGYEGPADLRDWPLVVVVRGDLDTEQAAVILRRLVADLETHRDWQDSMMSNGNPRADDRRN